MKITPFFKTASPFSNWYRSDFVCTSLGGYDQKYNCMEQYMMHSKALLFYDHEIGKQIMKATQPRDQKALGRQVSNFDDTVWISKARNIVRQGLKAKFCNNLDLKAKLAETKGTILVEASPYDKIWGVGLSENDERINDMTKWLGLNWLGFLLTDLREQICL